MSRSGRLGTKGGAAFDRAGPAQRAIPAAHFLAFFLGVIFLSGCGTTPKTRSVEPVELSERIPFIRNGITPRQEFLNRLGEPRSTYESNSVVIYWMQEVLGEQLRPVTRRKFPRHMDGTTGQGWEEGHYDLVLVFDANDILQQHSLVFMR